MTALPNGTSKELQNLRAFYSTFFSTCFKPFADNKGIKVGNQDGFTPTVIFLEARRNLLIG